MFSDTGFLDGLHPCSSAPFERLFRELYHSIISLRRELRFYEMADLSFLKLSHPFDECSSFRAYPTLLMKLRALSTWEISRNYSLTRI